MGIYPFIGRIIQCLAIAHGSFSASLTVTILQPYKNHLSSHRLGAWLQAGTLTSPMEMSARGAASRPQCT
jgi:hypothetical protein